MTSVKVASSRTVAFKALCALRKNTTYVQDFLKHFDAFHALLQDEKSFVQHVACGVISSQSMVDKMLAQYVKRLAHQPYKVLICLRMATYELVYRQTAAYAVVSQYVELVRLVDKRGASFVNAVLHRIAAHDQTNFAHARQHLVRIVQDCHSYDDILRVINAAPISAESQHHLLQSYGFTCESDFLCEACLVSGLPTWIVKRVYRDRGLFICAHMALAAQAHVPFYVCKNPYNPPQIPGELVPVQNAWGSYKLYGISPAALYNDIEGQRLTISDFAAQCIAACVVHTRPKKLLEIGCGKGTKSLLISYMNKRLSCPAISERVVCDKSPQKLACARKRLSRAHINDPIRFVAHDATTLDTYFDEHERFDTVFIDAPCSGSGTMRRHVEAPTTMSEAALDVACSHSLVYTQYELLRAASRLVNVGGFLIYATCSIFSCENEDVVSAFLASDAGKGFTCTNFPRAWTQELHVSMHEVVTQAYNSFSASVVDTNHKATADRKTTADMHSSSQAVSATTRTSSQAASATTCTSSRCGMYLFAPMAHSCDSHFVACLTRIS
ncbi:transcription antitermination factor NusB [Fannyhessea vaginae]|uniref:transcription antitermination factor NusB n=1 Tax=Fannyhessea vaginae TaxID=82135 RepID=UPI0023F0917A|nr:transcription antitermination factor NusB [Fannyhessea vaginae]